MPPTPSPAALGARLGRPIVLVGLMGAGKSTIGRRLATRLGLPFVDADVEIERAAAMTVGEIFERFGEAYFRDGERRVIARLMSGEASVIATGGGAFMDERTRALILGEAISIWLDADVATLAERVARRGTRPMVRDRNPGEVLTDLARIRNPVYALAQLHVRSETPPHEATVDRIIEALSA